MSVIGYDTVASPRSVRAKRPVWQQAARAMQRLDRGERYSPVLCVATLLIVGLLVKTAPLIQVYLAHN